jgi:DNA-binding NtrC family response regulator
MSADLPIVVSWFGDSDCVALNKFRLFKKLPLTSQGSLLNQNRPLSACDEQHGHNGPLRTFTDEIKAATVYILVSLKYKDDLFYIKKWVERGSRANVITVPTNVKDPSSYDEVKEALFAFHDKYWKEADADRYIFNVTPGSSAMEAVTLYLAHTFFIGARTYQTISPDHVKKDEKPYREVNLPFRLPSVFFSKKKVDHNSSTADSKVLEKARYYARFNGINILISGRTGVGKSELAKQLHYECGGLDDNFVTVNCAEISCGDLNTLRAELFGVKSRFDANSKPDSNNTVLKDDDFKLFQYSSNIPYSDIGYFEKALNGTLFLDEIADIPLSYQGVLLRALQERSITKLGDNKTIDIKSVRIIAATNKDLVKEVEEGRFREDLFYRLAMCQIRLPQLSEIILNEPERFKEIINSILIKIKQNGDNDLNSLEIDADAMRFIKNYEWPGNVRQLHHVLMLSALNANFEKRNTITVDDITTQLLDAGVPKVFDDAIGNKEIPSNIEDWLNERKQYFMKRLYDEYHGNISEIAKRSGMSYQKVQYFYKTGGH